MSKIFDSPEHAGGGCIFASVDYVPATSDCIFDNPEHANGGCIFDNQIITAVFFVGGGWPMGLFYAESLKGQHSTV